LRNSDRRFSLHLTGTAFPDGKNGQVLRGVLDIEIGFGRRFSEDAWRIDLSTMPWIAGLEI
jgi:hypothetical protein